MKSNQWLKILVLLVCMLSVHAAALAGTITGIDVMSARQMEGEPKMFVEVRAMNSAGVGESMRQEEYFTFSAKETALPASFVSAGQLGHIIVVDTSRYYFEGKEYITAANIQNIVSVYLDSLKYSERIRFILANQNGSTDTGYMPLEDAKTYVSQIKLGTAGDSAICSAITTAFEEAINPGEDAPMFNTVFIVADPDMETNGENTNSLASAAQMAISSDIQFDVFIAMPRREQFIKATNERRRNILESGFAAYQNFASKVSGHFVVLKQLGEVTQKADKTSIDTTVLFELLNKYFYTSNQYIVDYTALEEYLTRDPKIQTVEFTVTGDNGVSRKFDFNVLVDLLPQVVRTPAPVAPTPTPKPTPVVHLNQEDASAVKAIRALRNMNYLASVNYNSFNSECFAAYVDFCERNGLNSRDGVYEEEYSFLISEQGIAKPVVTPEPTPEPTPSPTPVPTIPPEGYNINDTDTPTSGGFIVQIQDILKRLNCYGVDAQANAGRMDRATLDAINTYCKAYGWSNKRSDGVDREIVEGILNNGGNLEPLKVSQPSAKERARAFLMSELHIMQWTIPMYIPVIACAVLIFIIVTIFLLTREDSKKSDQKSKQKSGQKPVRNVGQSTLVEQMKRTGTAVQIGARKPECEGDSEGDTAEPYSAKYVHLNISYEGQNKQVDAKLGKNPFIIARQETGVAVDLALNPLDKSVSRKCHAELVYQNGQVYIRDKSRFGNTELNGTRVCDISREGIGVSVQNGAMIKISEHRIVITW